MLIIINLISNTNIKLCRITFNNVKIGQTKYRLKKCMNT